jgi:hypothetical protein
MDLDQLLKLAKEYDDLGWAVQDQLLNVVEDSSPENVAEQSPEAIRMMKGWLEHADWAGVDEAAPLLEDLNR